MTILALIATASILVQALHWHFIFQKAARPPAPKAGSAGQAKPFLSVVVCFHRPLPNIPKIIDCITAQSYKDFEMILVNDGPVSDENLPWTADLPSIPFLKYLRHPKNLPGKKEALFAGIEMSRGPWIVVTDIDCQPGPEWLKSLADHIVHHYVIRSPDPPTKATTTRIQPGILLGFSPYAYRPGLLNFIIRHETLLTAFQYLGWAQYGRAYMGVGRNMASHQSIYLKYTFESHKHIPTGDDDLFVNQAAETFPVNICTDPRSFVVSLPKEGWKAWLRQKLRHNSGGKFYSTNSKIRLSIFTSALIIEKALLLWILFLRIDLFLALALLKMIVTIAPLQKLYRTFALRERFWQMWLYEWIHVFYLVVVSPYALFLNKKRWD